MHRSCLIMWVAVFILGACGEDSNTPSSPADTQQAADTQTTQETAQAAPDTQAEVLPTLAPPKEGEGFQLFMTTVVEPYSEAWICEVYKMPIEGVSSVNWVEFVQTPGLHHMTLSTPGFTPGLVPYGTHDCNVLYKDLMETMIMFFGNQGAANDVLELPKGIAAQFPAGIDVVHEIHYVNVTDKPVTIVSYLNAYTIPQDEVKEGIWGGQVRDEYINIPPKAEEHTEWTRCVMNEDVDVLFLASHMHGNGAKFTIRKFDGKESGDIFYTNDDWHDPKITQYDPPMVVKAGTGFEYACTWKNPNDTMLTYGVTSDDEMCNLAIVHAPMSMSAKCEVVESSDGVLWK